MGRKACQIQSVHELFHIRSLRPCRISYETHSLVASVAFQQSNCACVTNNRDIQKLVNSLIL